MTTVPHKPMTGLELAQNFQKGDSDPVEYLEQTINKITASQEEGIFISYTFERAYQEAQLSRKRYAAQKPIGPLDGVPIAWKDLFDMRATVTTAGSSVYRDAPPAEKDAVAVQLLQQQGMVSVGKVNLSEWAYSGVGVNPHFGTPRNPYSDQALHVTGGSSSGSAAAVAHQFVPISMGTDTAGSIRVPASFCGLVGFKPSAGRYVKKGIFPLSKTLDSFGPLAHDVNDCIAVDRLLTQTPYSSATVTDQAQKITFIVPNNIVMDDLAPEVKKVFDDFLHQLAQAGHTLYFQHVPALDQAHAAMQRHGTLTAAEAYVHHRHIVDSEHRKHVDPRVIDRILHGKTMAASDYLELFKARETIQKSFFPDLENAMVLFPTVPHLPPSVEELTNSAEDFHRLNLKTLRNTILGSYLNMPGISLPVGLSSSGFPVGVLLSTKTDNDDLLLHTAAQLEQFCS